jgi:hypothetical protein
MWDKLRRWSVRFIQGIQEYGFDIMAFLSLQVILCLTVFVVSHTLDTLNKIDLTLEKLPVIMQSEMQKTRTVMIYEAEQDRIFIEAQHLQTKEELFSKMNEIDLARQAILQRIEQISKHPTKVIVMPLEHVAVPVPMHLMPMPVPSTLSGPTSPPVILPSVPVIIEHPAKKQQRRFLGIFPMSGNQ